ncbi:MAG: MFS transporter [Syntrophaceae bacterium]|nr:MFS transporter [Syntrophaceae bacterium]
MQRHKPTFRNPWAWVPTLYLAEGIPYAMVMTVSVILYKRLGVSNTDIALYTSWLYLPWVIKPFWSPLVDLFRTKRLWIVAMQLVLGASFACVALALPGPSFFRYSLACFWIMAFSSATHDIAADGFYMLGLKEYQQSAFIGVRVIFYRIAMIASKGILVVLAGVLETRGFPVASAWSLTFCLLAAVMLSFALYHLCFLPYPAVDGPVARDLSRGAAAEFLRGFVTFFKRKDIGAVVAFLLFYRFAEAQLVKMVAPFLLDDRAQGGLGLSTVEVGIVYGTVGAVALMLGGLLGGWVISRKGLRYWLWIMVCATHLPDVIFVWLSQALPENLLLINVAVALEQFGYGFGFTAYSLVMIMVSEGEHKTVHYAIATGIMALGTMIPAMTSGWIQEQLGYAFFFLWVLLSTIPGFIVAALIKIDPSFGKGK